MRLWLSFLMDKYFIMYWELEEHTLKLQKEGYETKKQYTVYGREAEFKYQN